MGKVAAYAGELLCPRCGNGYPVCADFPSVKGRRMRGGQDLSPQVHERTCLVYRFSQDLCAACESQILS